MSKISKELIERYVRQELDRKELAQKACCGKMTVPSGVGQERGNWKGWG